MSTVASKPNPVANSNKSSFFPFNKKDVFLPFLIKELRIYTRIIVLENNSGISSDDTKYSALVANLDAETLSYVSDIVLSPPNSDKYHTLSQRLITQFSDSETQKIKKLLTDLQLGDEKPSHLLRKMKELSNGQLQDDFLQSLWLQRMPPHIQTVLSASSQPLDKLAIIADKVSEVVGSSSTICAASTVPPPSQ
ncbi:uncharacterized protein TNCV_4758931 [Trichonephila clavipes]|nr:uncharacterized protein TNCV_4758931 [Trichonephila clavipes]